METVNNIEHRNRHTAILAAASSMAFEVISISSSTISPICSACTSSTLGKSSSARESILRSSSLTRAACAGIFANVPVYTQIKLLKLQQSFKPRETNTSRTNYLSRTCWHSWSVAAQHLTSESAPMIQKGLIVSLSSQCGHDAFTAQAVTITINTSLWLIFPARVYFQGLVIKYSCINCILILRFLVLFEATTHCSINWQKVKPLFKDCQHWTTLLYPCSTANLCATPTSD